MRYILFILLVGIIFQEVQGQSADGAVNDSLYIQDIVITGNKVTHSKIILREIIFSPGDKISKMELLPGLQRSKDNLLNLSIFNFVSFDTEYLDSNRIILIVDVTERWYIWPTPIFEHGDRNLSAFLKEPRWNKINYGLWLKWNNFRGRNELLNAKVRLGYKEQYMLQYEKPNLGASQNHKLFLSYSLIRQHRVNYITLDNLPVYYTDEEDYAVNSADAFIAYSYRPEYFSRHRIRLHYRNDWVSEAISTLNPDFLGDGINRIKYFNVDYVFNYDLRDSKIYPLEGDAYKFKLQRYGLGLLKEFPYPGWEMEAAVFYHRKLVDRLYFAGVTKGKTASNKEVPLYFKQALGYTEFLTGYDDYVIDGTDYIISKFILKYQLVKPFEFSIPYLKAKQFSRVHYSMYLNLLGDVGYVNNKYSLVSNQMDNALQYSIGVGLDFVTYYDKVLGIVFALNRYGTSGFFFHIATPFYEW